MTGHSTTCARLVRNGPCTCAADPINPAHYTSSESGVECITITRWMSFDLGSAVKYLWRCGRKDDAQVEIEKAIWFLTDEIDRVSDPAAEWPSPPDPDQWMDRFVRHIATVKEFPIAIALQCICSAAIFTTVDPLIEARAGLINLAAARSG